MTVPIAPFPRVRHLLQAITARPFTGEPWVGGRSGFTALIYRRGSLAMAAGIESIRNGTRAATITIWVPGYFCNEALEHVRRLPIILKFYPIREDLTVDWMAVAEEAAQVKGLQVLLLVHYFGFPNAVDYARAFCDQYGLVLIEDAAHVLLPGGGIGQGELLFFSPRKILAVPSGGVLVISEEMADSLHVPSGGNAWKETLGWLIRRLIQRLLTGLHISWHLLWKIQAWCTKVEKKHAISPEQQAGCDSYALRLLTVTAQQTDEVARRRRQNYARLLEWVEGLAQVQPLFPVLPEGICPYAFPLLVARGCEDVVVRLQVSGIPASRWPDLPPEVLANGGKHKVAIRTYEQLLLLPVHQSATLKQMDEVGRRLRTALDDPS